MENIDKSIGMIPLAIEVSEDVPAKKVRVVCDETAKDVNKTVNGDYRLPRDFTPEEREDMIRELKEQEGVSGRIPELVFGRERRAKYLEIAEKIAEQRANVIFLAPRRCGKSTLTNMVEKKLTEKPDHVTISLNPSSTWRQIIKHVGDIFNDLTPEEAESIRKATPDDLAGIIQSLMKNGRWNGKRLTFTGNEHLEIYMTSGRSFDIKDPAKELSGLFTIMESCREKALPVNFLFASVNWCYPKLLRRLRKAGHDIPAPDSRAFELVEMQMMNKSEAGEMVDFLFELTGEIFESEEEKKEIKERIVEHFHHPYVFKMIISSIMNRGKSEKSMFSREKLSHLYKNVMNFGANMLLDLSDRQKDLLSLLTVTENNMAAVKASSIRKSELDELKKRGLIDYSRQDGAYVVELLFKGLIPIMQEYFRKIAFIWLEKNRELVKKRISEKAPEFSEYMDTYIAGGFITDAAAYDKIEQTENELMEEFVAEYCRKGKVSIRNLEELAGKKKKKKQEK